MAFLDDILTSTRARIADLEEYLTEDALEERIASRPAARSLRGALEGDDLSVIAEIKRVSPATGPLNEDLNAT